LRNVRIEYVSDKAVTQAFPQSGTHSARTDSSGRFKFENLPAGKYGAR
jgi:hypothetical protein